VTENAKTEDFRFGGFQAPSYTQVPDEAFDVLMAVLTPAEFKVMMYIIRRTFGFNKGADAISISQIVSGVCTKSGRRLDMGTGLSRQGVVNALAGLVQKNVVLSEQRQSAELGFEPTVYCLNIVGQGMQFPDPEDPRYQHTVSQVPPSQLSGLEQDTDVIQETEQQHPSVSESLRVSSPAPASEPPSPVVVASEASHPTANDALTPQLTALGVAQSTARRLLQKHDHQLIQRWLAYTEHRLSHGWVPKESLAAWLVSAIRSEDWVIPSWFQTPEEQAREQTQLAAEDQARRDEEAKAEREQAEAQRRAIESELRIGERTRDVWDRARAILAERKQMSPALYTAYLLPLRGTIATVVTPVGMFRDRIAQHAEAIREAIESATGKAIERVDVEFAELSMFEAGP